MEIKSINTSPKISKVHTASKEALDFSKGEIIIAKIVSIDGEIVTLKTKEEMIFTAKILSRMDLSIGDNLKLVVKGKQAGKLIMQALSVNADTVELSTDVTTQQGSGKQILLIAGLFKNIDIEPTNESINEIMSVLEKNPGLDPKTAVFMVVNEIAVTEESIEIVKQLETSGNFVSDKLIEILNQIIVNESYPQNEKAEILLKLLGESNTYQNQDAEAQTARLRADVKPMAVSVAANNTFYSIVPSKVTHEVQNRTGDANESSSIAGGQETNALNSEILAETENVKMVINSIFEQGAGKPQQYIQSPTPQNTTNDTNTQNILQSKSLQPVLAKIISLFADVDDIKSGKAGIKKENQNKIEKLLELKETLKNSDIKNRDVLAAKTDKIISQSKLSSDINRFNLYHVPINLGRDRQTAEVYIYKRKRNKNKNKDSLEVNILIGLDTQNLGRFEVLIKANEKNLKVKMSRDSDRAKEIIELRARKLKKTFTDMGYAFEEFEIERLHERTTLANAEEVLIGKVAPSSTKIDYMI